MRKIHTFESYHKGIDDTNLAILDRLLEGRYDRDEYEDLDKSDRWLKKYVHEAMDKWPSSEVVEDLLDKYSNTKDVTVYRGMNFDTEEQFDSFMDSIKDGKFETSGISSWSRDKQTAWQFAVTRPTYFLNYELMRAEDKKSKEQEYMIGFKGVILKCEIKAGDGIDTGRSDFGAEDEIILPRGTYTVEVEQVKPFREMIKEQDPTSVVLGLTKEDVKEDSFNAQFFKYIMFHGHNISDEAKDHLFKMFMPKSEPIIDIKKDMSYWSRKEETEIRIGYKDGFPFMLYFYAAALGEKYKKSLTEISDKVLKGLIKELHNNTDFEKTHISGNIGYWSQYFNKYGTPSLVNKYKNLISGRLAAEYKKLSNDDIYMTDKVKEINKISDPDKKRDAIDDYAKELERTLKNILAMAS